MTDYFTHFRKAVEKKIAGSIDCLGEKTKLRDACEYALTNGGKRFRPLIVLMVADALKNDLDVSEAALSVEFFHTASLIADDLPCMDNDDTRRDKPSLHKVYGETIALLASYTLITAAFEGIYKNAELILDSKLGKKSDAICKLALGVASRCSGILGATGGQFLDIYPPVLTLESIKDVIYKKTVTLFEVSFVFGWLFGGGDLNLLDKVKKVAYHMGMAFQIADDLGDIIQDAEKKKEISIINNLGAKKSYALFLEEMELFNITLKELSLDTPAFKKLSDELYLQAAQSMNYSVS